ncbi:hypothetical protein [Desmospora profundinema]|uniref:Uncharacterized protein n=1 Tax=Desmospora profundinema TaxID=1571184 RepID=A0ABU1IGZ6_9BACL|nr:hypothetical protein [Desmospora profundinema]MDR6224055.1 hypothetical protein [Desmospora profundinema]
MKRIVMSAVALVLALVMTFSVYTEAGAASKRYEVNLSGSGPVFTEKFTPGNRQVTVVVETYNNLNVGYDLMDTKDGTKIANGTIKKKGKIERKATAHRGRTYHLRLRCQEPPWNKTKCRAKGVVSW